MQQRYRGRHAATACGTNRGRPTHDWCLLALALLTLLWRAPAAASETDRDVSPAAMQSGSLLLRMKSGYVIATRMNSDVAIRVSGLAARVTVRQEFKNDGAEWVEGVYVFPLPDSAAVDRLRMYIGERFIEGEIREKQQARKEYEQAKTAGKKTSLVEQQRANLFTTSVANIAPGESISIEIEYQQTLHYDEGTFSLRFPMTLTPRYMPGTPVPGRKGSGWSPDTTGVSDASQISPPVVARSNGHRITLHAEINAGMPLEIIASRYHPIDVRDESGRYLLSLADTDVPMDHDFELLWRPVKDALPRASLFSEAAGGDAHLLLMIIPPDDGSAAIEPMPRELIFVIDTSGSMHGTSIEQARKALLLALDGLRPVDRFNVIQFNSVTSVFSPHSVAANAYNTDLAKRYVRRLSANGGTEMRPALQQALAAEAGGEAGTVRLRQIIFVTDGSVGNEEELFKLIESGLGRSRLFTVGIGSAPNGWFMRKAAEAGRGSYTFISALHEVNEKMQRLIRKLEQPQVTDLAVQWPDSVQAEGYPATIPDLYAGEPMLLRAKLKNAPLPGDLVKVSGDSGTGGWAVELPLGTGTDSPGVAAIWARAKIEDIEDRQRRGADPDEMRALLVETALAYKLVSKHTSLIAVDKTPVRPAGMTLDREQVPNLLPYGQSRQAIFGIVGTATAAQMHRWTGLACLMLAAMLFWLGRVCVTRPAI